MQTTSRRSFLGQVLTTTAAAVVLRPASPFLPGANAAVVSPQPIRLGGPGFVGAEDPEAFALAHRKLGYRAAYSPAIPLKETDKIKAIADACAKQDVVLAEVGVWCNLMEADSAKRRQNLQNVTNGLALAEAIGARCCVNIAGSYNPTTWYGPHPENFSPKFFDEAVENARAIIDAVKPTRAKFCYEVMGWALPDSPDSYLKLIKAIDRKGFGVHLDPCNAINSPAKFYDNAALLNEWFDKLGKYVASCHAKDLAWEVEMNVHFKEVIPGKGKLDYATYLRRLARLPQNPPLMLEHLSKAEEYAAGRDYILEVGRKEGLSFA